MIAATFRPIDKWPREVTHWQERRGSGHFKATYGNTLDLLEKELAHLQAKDIIIQIETDLSEIRNDGWPRSTARISGPRVAVGFASKHGPLIYYCDDCNEWTHNLRCIAMTLERLRMAELYGVTKRGEQYTGFKALPSGSSEEITSATEAAAVVVKMGGGNEMNIRNKPSDFQESYRRAVMACHPDRFPHMKDLWLQLQNAATVLKRHHNIA